MIQKHNATVIILAAIMNLFYVRHHYQSIVRSNSFGGEVFAFIVLAILFGGSIGYTYQFIDGYNDQVNFWLGLEQGHYLPFIMIYLLGDLAIKLVFKRPLPKVYYYLPWIDKSKEISRQYLLTSLFGIGPLIFFISLLLFAFKATEWMGLMYGFTVFLWWLTNHFIGLITQFSHPRVRSIVFVVILLTAFLLIWNPVIVGAYLFQPLKVFIALLSTISGSYILIHRSLEQREFVEIKEKRSVFQSLPSLSFNNPVFQLEWSLISRNKRTRSNLLMGLMSILLLSLVVKEDTSFHIVLLIYLFTTGFFIVQHGLYSFGWEGSYFDFLQVNIPPKIFIKTRYLFYAGTCAIGFILSLIPTIINGINVTLLSMIFLYNVGITIPIVLYRSTLNSTKISLSESAFMNYNGMMTAPIFVSSFLVTLLPILIYSLSNLVFEGLGTYALGGLGVVGLLLHHQIVLKISSILKKRKYHLSQSFKS